MGIRAELKPGCPFSSLAQIEQPSDNMKAKYDFSKGKRGAVLPSSGKKVRITIRLDRDIIDWFRSKVEEQGGGNYQTMLNDALRAYMGRQEQPFEEVIRRVVREELHAAQ
jgi:uncharacterized protein (DUF4415 family)